MDELKNVIAKAKEHARLQGELNLSFSPYVNQWLNYLTKRGKWNSDLNDHPYSFIELTDTGATFLSPDNEVKRIAISFYFMENGCLEDKDLKDYNKEKPIELYAGDYYGSNVQANKNLCDLIHKCLVDCGSDVYADQLTATAISDVSRRYRERTKIQLVEDYLNNFFSKHYEIRFEDFKKVVRKDIEESGMNKKYIETVIEAIDDYYN